MVRLQSRSLGVHLWRWELRISSRTWLFEATSRRRDRIAKSCVKGTDEEAACLALDCLVFAMYRSDGHWVTAKSALRESSNERSQLSVHQHCSDSDVIGCTQKELHCKKEKNLRTQHHNVPLYQDVRTDQDRNPRIQLQDA